MATYTVLELGKRSLNVEFIVFKGCLVTLVMYV